MRILNTNIIVDETLTSSILAGMSPEEVAEFATRDQGKFQEIVNAVDPGCFRLLGKTDPDKAMEIIHQLLGLPGEWWDHEENINAVKAA